MTIKINLVLYCLPQYHKEGLVLISEGLFPSIVSTDIDDGIDILLDKYLLRDKDLSKDHLRLRHYDQNSNLLNLYFSTIVSPQEPLQGQFMHINEIKDNVKEIIQKTHPFL